MFKRVRPQKREKFEILFSYDIFTHEPHHPSSKRSKKKETLSAGLIAGSFRVSINYARFRIRI